LIINIFTLLIALFILGCWDSKDINEKTIVTTLLGDRKDGEIWFYIEIANIQASQGGQAGGESGTSSASEKYIVIKAHGKTFDETRQNLDMQAHYPIYLSGSQTLLLTEDFAKVDLIEYLYRLRADENYRKKVITVITRKNPEELFKAMNEQNLSVGYEINKLIKTLDEGGLSFSRSTMRIIENLSDDYTGILIPCIGLQEKQVSLEGYEVVNGNKTIGHIPIEKARGIIILKADKAKTSFIVPYKDIKFSVETTLSKRKIKASYKDGKIGFDVKLAFRSRIMYGDKKTPYELQDEDLKRITKELEKIIKKEVMFAINQAQKVYKTDYFQMDDAFRIKYPAEFEKMDWQKEFPKADINVDVKADLRIIQMMDYSTKSTK